MTSVLSKGPIGANRQVHGGVKQGGHKLAADDGASLA